jgi:hypothetical protein
MKGLKITLWVSAIFFLLSSINVTLPWGEFTAWSNQRVVLLPTAGPLTVFWVWLWCMTYGMIGVLFLIFARNPLKYGEILRIAAYGLLLLGVFLLIGNIHYAFPLKTYIVKVIFCLIFGALMVLFRKEAIQSNNA